MTIDIGILPANYQQDCTRMSIAEYIDYILFKAFQYFLGSKKVAED